MVIGSTDQVDISVLPASCFRIPAGIYVELKMKREKRREGS
jgi:hypothetical protein